MKILGKNVVIYGGGVSGLSAYELVRDKGARAVIYDDNPNCAHATNSKSIFSSADIIVMSPGVSCNQDFIRDAVFEGKTLTCELELASSFCYGEQIAVTGTNGKTTTTMLIDRILKRAGKKSYAVGNIGTPFSAVADKLDTDEIAVIETSSFQLECCTKFSPDIAIMLNIAPDHLDRHGTMSNYIAAKSKIFKMQGEQDIAIYNDDDEIVKSVVQNCKAQKIPFSRKHPLPFGAYISSGFLCYDGTPILHCGEVDFKGAELENVLAAIACCANCGVSSHSIASGIMEFSKPAYRREKCAEAGGIAIYNDSKATNISACLSAAECIDDAVLILGGARRAENFFELFEKLPKSIKHIVITGENEAQIASCASAIGGCDFEICADLEEALNRAFTVAKQRGISSILFSPASKSFDKFSNYCERGEFFSSLARKLEKEKK